MSVPKKRTSYQKKKMRYFRWVTKILKYSRLFYSQGSLRRQIIDKSTKDDKKSNN